MHHIALDRPGPDDRHLHHQVVELARAEPGQHAHLRPALHLEDAQRIGLAQHVVDERILLWHRDQIEIAVIVEFDQFEAAADGGQHAQRQHVDLHDLQFVDVVLVPFDEGAVLHRAIADRHGLDQRPLGQDEAADVLGEVAREVDQLGGQVERQFQPCVLALQAGGVHMLVLDLGAVGAPDRIGQRRGDVLGQAQRLADVADRRTRTIVDDRGADRRAVAAITSVDVLHDLFAPLVLEIDIDVRRLAALLRDEAFEQHVLFGRIDRGDAEAITDHGIGRRTAPLAEDFTARFARPGNDVMHRKKIGGVANLGDQPQLLVDGLEDVGRDSIGKIPLRPLEGQVLEVLLRRLTRRNRLVGILVGELV